MVFVFGNMLFVVLRIFFVNHIIFFFYCFGDLRVLFSVPTLLSSVLVIVTIIASL